MRLISICAASSALALSLAACGSSDTPADEPAQPVGMGKPVEPGPAGDDGVHVLPMQPPPTAAEGGQATATGEGTGVAPGTSTADTTAMGGGEAGATGAAADGAEPRGDDPDLAIDTVSSIELDTELASLCRMSTSAVFFKFDAANLSADAKDRLEALATCVKSGPAKGRELVIIGRADPRGTDAYNQKLGMSRAQSVATYLQQQGVKQARLETESKGEEEASSDPTKWPRDRRVTVRLAD